MASSPASAQPVYLDYQATTPLDPRVSFFLHSFLEQSYGNPHSVNHYQGQEAARAVRIARSHVADLISAGENEIIFTSGATESCNLAIRGVAGANHSERSRVVTLATEHPAVLETVIDLERDGFESVVLPVQANGLVDLDVLDAHVNDQTLLVSIMAVNNEIGVIQPLPAISEICQKAGAFLHTDATQAPGRIEIDVEEMGVDLLSLSAHKFYGPKGVGMLFRRTSVPIRPICTGGGQEYALRPGTVAAPFVAAMGEAAHLVDLEFEADVERIEELTNVMRTALVETCPQIRFYGDMLHRAPGNLCFGVPKILGIDLAEAVAGMISISTGSACSSATVEPSKVLLALGVSPPEATSAVRVSLGRFTTRPHIDVAVDAFSRAFQVIL